MLSRAGATFDCVLCVGTFWNTFKNVKQHTLGFYDLQKNFNTYISGPYRIVGQLR